VADNQVGIRQIADAPLLCRTPGTPRGPHGKSSPYFLSFLTSDLPNLSSFLFQHRQPPQLVVFAVYISDDIYISTTLSIRNTANCERVTDLDPLPRPHVHD